MQPFPLESELSRPLIEAMPDGIVVVGEDGLIRQANGRAEQMFGYAEGELAGQPLDLLVPAGARDPHPKARARFFSTGGTRSMGSGIDLEGRRRDGSLFPVDVSLALVTTPEGQVAVAAIRDVRDRAGLVAALRASEARYRLLVENATEIVYRISFGADPMGGTVEFMSPQVEAITGVPPEEFLRDPGLWIQMIHPADREGLRSRTEAILASGIAGTRTYRIRQRHPEGYRWLEDRIIPNRDADGPRRGFQGVARDVTERFEVEAERQRLEGQLRQARQLEAVGRLAGGVAHDFNNLLTVIIGCAEMAASDLDPALAAQSEIAEVLAAARRAAGLTQQLLAFGRLQTIAPRVLALNTQLRGLERMLRRVIIEDIRLTFDLDDQVWAVRLDPSQLDQLVLNLVVNARDAMPEGGLLAIRTENVALDEGYFADQVGCPPGEYVALSISDTGGGMDRATLDRIFEPFFTTKGEGKGTGLGLATVYGIVKQNDGHIKVYSEPGIGTTVKVYFLRYTGTGAPAVEAASPAPAGGSETVLLVEDDVQLRRLTRRLLERQGYRVLEAAGPEEALELGLIHGGVIRLLLTDVIMPTMNGALLSAQMTATNPRIRTLFMSGYPADIISHRGLLHEGINLLQKPFDARSLGRRIREVLAQP